ncbi:hypothetical protein PSAB6_250016 [Paraburkholderia sabiae]|nr:hypothetical protein PSAB6_250016 [Paraburkholderia sabiae]
MIQTSIVGGESVTAQTALAVRPQRPLGPSVVMTLTAAGTHAIASRKRRFIASFDIACSSGSIAHGITDTA